MNITIKEKRVMIDALSDYIFRLRIIGIVSCEEMFDLFKMSQQKYNFDYVKDKTDVYVLCTDRYRLKDLMTELNSFGIGRVGYRIEKKIRKEKWEVKI